MEKKNIENINKRKIEIGPMFQLVATGIAIIAFNYMTLKNFETRIENKFIAMDQKFVAMDQKLEARLMAQDEKIFWLATGKTLAQAMLDEKMKEKK